MKIENLTFQKKITINKNDSLLIIDMQYDFMPGGALHVEEGDQIIDDINLITEIFKINNGIVVLTQDWHPKNHKSFASNYPGKDPGDEFQSEGIGPVIWPDHCVRGTHGALIDHFYN